MKYRSKTETNNLIRAACIWVEIWIGIKREEHRKKNEPRWKRKIDGDIKSLRKEVDFLDGERKGELELIKK